MSTTSHATAGAHILDDLLAAGAPALLVIGSASCAACDSAGVTLQRLADEYAGRLKVVAIDVAAAPGLLERVGLARLPGLIFVRGGRELARLAGVVPEPALRSWIDYTVYGGVQPPVPHGPSARVPGPLAAGQPAYRPRYDDF